MCLCIAFSPFWILQIGNKILTLNLTKLQKDKVQSYLDRMTPEQQQQYLQTQQGILNRIQRQQELNTQIQAQVEAQKQKQQLQNQQQQANAQITVVTQKNIVPGKVILYWVTSCQTLLHSEPYCTQKGQNSVEFWPFWVQ